VEDQHDSSVNVTSLTAFADCPRKYYLQRYVGWNGRPRLAFDPEETAVEDDDAEDLTAADLGSLVHEVLAGKAGDYPPEARQLADVFFASALGKRAAAAERSGREWDFIADIDGTLVRGTVDLWFEEPGGMVVVDYKTDAQPRPEAYAPQLALYALAIERAFAKRPVEAWLYFLRRDTPVRVPVDDAAIHRVQELLAELSRAQNELRFDLLPGEHCRSCPFHRTLCPAE
jgi:CRISPR/Cas system-associated exonuclease Cas4 (RecB family)